MDFQVCQRTEVVCILCGASACYAQLYVNAVTCMYVKMCTRAHQSIGRGVFWYKIATTYVYIYIYIYIYAPGSSCGLMLAQHSRLKL